ncbi:helix-turn-helix domain-containing protein [Desulfovibrio intestinalis]|uniref:DNA-binding transcriptional regulator YiaG n=1 Tax=Desulfovibrio intestinalis TaxID=58621 RepID=A0A7W8C1K7_9BACT|nr:helix-turn-helix transcriptional regulator [Desulfovibrio intestinalis]MBB5142514.1 DNA-binding transcriptional regulator YiaG [Desulfovibrio intestinalis]
MVEKVLSAMHSYGLREENESIPWREAFSTVSDEDIPGVYLRGARYRENLTQRQFSEKTEITVPHLSAMENGKRPIGKKNARLLADALNVDPRRLLTV